MVTVAIVGLDGAGKTTVTRRLVDRLPFQATYLYMGMNPDSSNVSLPTTRLVHGLRRRSVNGGVEGPVSLHAVGERRRRRGKVWSTLRLFNRLAEESVRHIIAQVHVLRRAVVVTDRDFLIDYAVAAKEPVPLSDRIHLWVLRTIMPKPDLVVWLDAPSEVLYGRKSEVPISYLERRRQRIGELRSAFERFEVVDANRPLDEVYRAVEDLVVASCEGRRVKLRRKDPNS
jgi:thymidylate kinase